MFHSSPRYLEARSSRIPCYLEARSSRIPRYLEAGRPDFPRYLEFKPVSRDPAFSHPFLFFIIFLLFTNLASSR